MKKVLLFAVMLVLTFAANAYDFLDNGIAYDLNSDGCSVTVTSGGSYSDDIIVPEKVTFNGKSLTVTAIGDKAFSMCRKLTSVTIPNSVTSIGSSAFQVCSKLSSVNIPNGVTTIGDRAFYTCRALTSIVIPNTVTSSIGRETFAQCTGLTSVALGNSITAIGDMAFSGCTGLSSIRIPNSVTSIGKEAFYECSNLATVRSLITEIYDVTCSGDAFYNIAYPAVLYVPVGTAKAYRKLSPWNALGYIKELGDVTGDGKVDIEDVNACINIILEIKDTSDYPSESDLTGDGKVDVEDVNMLINMILSPADPVVTTPDYIGVEKYDRTWGWGMVKVYDNTNVFWQLVYIDDKGVEFSSWWNSGSGSDSAVTIEEFSSVTGDKATDIIKKDDAFFASKNPGWYLVVITTSVINRKVVYNVQFNEPNVWMIGPVTPQGAWQELEEGCLFEVPDGPYGEFVSPPFAHDTDNLDGGVRAYVKISPFAWWKSEFMVYDGWLRYRGDGPDQDFTFGYRVSGKTGERIFLNFYLGTGRIGTE
ncbi:MAG: leucine-rich repeat protein [Muribaculaceae bacterium]|nr:leucine-rich repeat protein [Muribaculaceae bacterium]